MNFRFIVFLCLAASVSFAQTKIINHSDKALTFDFTLPDVSRSEMELDNRVYTHFSYENSRHLAEAGAPMTPSSLLRIAVPPGATVQMSYSILAEEALNGTDVLPASVVSGIKGDNRIPIDQEIYSSAAPYPGEMVRVSNPYLWRQMQMVDIEIFPVQYSPADHRVRLLKQVRVDLRFSGANISGSSYQFSSGDRAVLGRRLLNFPQAAGWTVPLQRKLGRVSSYDFNQGEWYKIPVSAQGVQRLTGSAIESEGVDIGDIDLSTVQLFNYGGLPLKINTALARPQDLNEIAVEVIDRNGDGNMDSDDEILFYSRGLGGLEYDEADKLYKYRDHVFDTRNYVLFTFNQYPGKRIETVSSPNDPLATTPSQFEDFRRYEVDTYNILQSGQDWYWKEFIGTSDNETFTISLPQGALSSDATFSTRIQGGSGAKNGDPSGFAYTVQMILNGQTLFSPPGLSFSNNTTINRNHYVNLNPPIATDAFVPGENEVQFVYNGNQEGCFIYLDFIEARFQRSFAAENDFLQFRYGSSASPHEFSISGLPSGTHRVWNVTDYANVSAVNPLQNGSTVRFQSNSLSEIPETFRVFANGSILDLTQVIALENSPNLRDPSRRGKMLMIVADEFYETAGILENLKENELPPADRMEVERIKVSEIFREFSSAVQDPTAIRDFVKYARENWDQSPQYRPEYVWLIGDGSYDYRNIELTNYINRVPPFEITNKSEINSRAADNYYTSINNISDGYTSFDPQLAIGRLPANSAGDIENYYEKLLAYSQAYKNEDPVGAGWQTLITFVADDECADGCNEWFHLQQTERLAARVPGKFDLRKIYLTDYADEAGGLGRTKPGAAAALLDQINRGTSILNFYGHGDPNTWAHEQVLNKGRDLPLIQNGARLPLWVAATCTWGRYDDPNVPSMAEEMIWSESGGGIAVIAACRAVYAFQNENFVGGVFDDLFGDVSKGALVRVLGDAVLASLTGTENDQKYHLFGDPSLSLAPPAGEVTIEAMAQDTLKALSTPTVRASVTDTLGNRINNFNGKALVRVYDAVDSTSANNGVEKYVYPGRSIFRGIVTVENGELQSTFIIPKSIKYAKSHTGRISIYAWSDDEILQDASGYGDTLLFLGTVDQVDDALGPQIDFEIDGQPDFFDGDYISRQATVVVRLFDDSGLNLTGEVGHQIELRIDDAIRKDVTNFFVYDENSYQSGQLSYQLPTLSPGTHRLTITAWDNLNNYSEQQISLTTASATNAELAQVVNFPNPFSDETHFTFQYQSPIGLAEVRVRIYTVSGRLIQELTDIARPGFNKIYWDGRDRDGDLVSNGTYLYKLMVDDGDRVVEKIEKVSIVR